MTGSIPGRMSITGSGLLKVRRGRRMTTIAKLEDQLNDFDEARREKVLKTLVSLARQDELPLPEPAEVANMHSHTFFSFNGYGHSPSSLAWLARKKGLKLMGIVDFDVLDGVDEFLDACETVGVRGSAGMETRVYLPQFADRESSTPRQTQVD